jgi:multidrug efflux pump subunit AcrA (membrane-fusion protein)
VYVKVDNKDRLFLPGMHAEIDLEYQVFENVIKVPRDAVIFRQERYLVFVVRDVKRNIGTANWEYVTIGHQNDEEIEILSGVKEGDLVLVEGHKTLAHQSRVKVIK